MLELLKQMAEITAVSGKEGVLRDLIIEQIKPFAEYEIDPWQSSCPQEGQAEG